MDSLVTTSGPVLSVSDDGEGEEESFILLHGLTSVKRYVLMGSKLLQKSGMRAVSYDARGHGLSTAARERGEYGYDFLREDLVEVLAGTGLSQPVGIGVSMGAHTLAAAAVDRPDLFSGLLLITPAYRPGAILDSDAEAHWRGLANGLRTAGPQGFIAAGAVDSVDEKWKELAARATLQRMEQHEHPEAVADALDVVPWSKPFESWAQFEDLKCPVTVIGSRDEADPGHPLEVAQEWADSLPNAKLEIEEVGESPLAWRGASISKLALELVI